MHILFLTDNFPPETNAPASRTFEHARYWVATGHKVTIVTGVPNFPSGKIHAGYRNMFYQREVMEGIDVVRVWTYISANEGFARRMLDYISFMFSAIIASFFVHRPDIVIGTSPQFFTPCAAYIVSVFKRRPFIFELRDLWPDSIVAVGAMRETFAIRCLRKLEYFLYRRADRIVSVTQSFRKVLSNNGIDVNKIAFVSNGVDLERFHPDAKPGDLVSKLDVGGKFVAAYVGTVGMAHGIGTLLEVARKLHQAKNIVFVVVGAGAEQKNLVTQCKKEGLTNVIFTGAVTKSEVKEYWRLCDVALVLLKDEPLFQHVVPSKIFEAMGMERPIILGVKGESATILDKSGAGITIQPEDAEALANAISSLAANHHLCLEYGKKGRQFVSEHYSREKLAMAMLMELEAITGKVARSSNGFES